MPKISRVKMDSVHDLFSLFLKIANGSPWKVASLILAGILFLVGEVVYFREVIPWQRLKPDMTKNSQRLLIIFGSVAVVVIVIDSHTDEGVLQAVEETLEINAGLILALYFRTLSRESESYERGQSLAALHGERRQPVGLESSIGPRVKLQHGERPVGIEINFVRQFGRPGEMSTETSAVNNSAIRRLLTLKRPAPPAPHVSQTSSSSARTIPSMIEPLQM